MTANQIVEDNGDRSKKLNRFIAKTYLIVNSDEPTVCWVHGGKSFLIVDPKKFSQTVLPKYFKHNKLTSFVRQLNFYGFHKIRIDPSTLRIDDKGANDKETMSRGDIICFQHKFFQANQPKLLQKIQRATKQSVATLMTESPSPAQKEMEQLQNQLQEMAKKTDSLRDEFELKLAAAKVELEVDYLHRIKALEVCYKDLLVLILGSKDPMPYTLPGLNKSLVDSTPRDHLVDHKLDRVSPIHIDNHRQKGLLFGNAGPWSNKAIADISTRIALKHVIPTEKGKLFHNIVVGGIKNNFETKFGTLPNKSFPKEKEVCLQQH